MIKTSQVLYQMSILMTVASIPPALVWRAGRLGCEVDI
jgi:hypothetical protein